MRGRRTESWCVPGEVQEAQQPQCAQVTITTELNEQDVSTDACRIHYRGGIKTRLQKIVGWP